MEVRWVGSVPVVSMLQLILDLWNYPVRGREQAERLLATLEGKMARSKGPEEGSIVEDSPRMETFRDCCGKKRDFEVFLNITDGGHFLRAREMRESPGGYEFAEHHPASPFVALGRLRQRIAEGLSTLDLSPILRTRADPGNSVERASTTRPCCLLRQPL
jgi:hypothetical protein